MRRVFSATTFDNNSVTAGMLHPVFVSEVGNSVKPVITVNNLKKTYDGVNVVDNISFNVRQGEIFGLLGPNGAGKTTTVEMIEGLRVPDGGNISLLGMDCQKDIAEIKQRIGVQLQIPSLMPLLNVEETLNLFGCMYRKSVPAKQIIELLGLEESRKVLAKNLSGGQQQRLSVAMAMVNDPEIAFLDEPSTGLDPQSRRQLWAVIEEMRARGKTILLTTHFMDEAEQLCDRLVIIDHGKIIAEGAPDELISTYFKESAIQFETDKTVDEKSLKKLSCATNVVVDKNEVVIYSSDIQTTIAALFDYSRSVPSAPQVKNLQVRQSTLEDVFLKLTGRRIRN
ncbi:MAG TPA: ABC transporter ATP-binding protein [Dehalococcoidales bacterium]|nr:ABC transporter ATP-binding protein [Dehalococcoidales bacterium]